MKGKFTAIYHTNDFANEFAEDGTLGRIRMPYGEYAYGDVACPDGKTRRVIQVWDRDSAELVKSALPNEGYPVYQGHPDVPDVAAKYPNKAAIGWVVGIEANDEDATLTVDWIQNPGRGFKWFSPYWCAEGEGGMDDEVVKVHVNALTSVGLVNNPRIKQFTLANEWSGTGDPATTPEPVVNNAKGGTNMDIKKLAALLGLPVEGLTEDQIVDEITKLQQAAVAAADEAKVKADDAQAKIDAAAAETAAANAEVEKQKQAVAEAEQRFENEREARIGLMLDNAIAGGNITPAGRTAWHDRLKKDIDKGALALANEKAVKTEQIVTQNAAADHIRGKTLLEIANEKMEASNGKMSFHAAFMKAKAEHPELVK